MNKSIRLFLPVKSGFAKYIIPIFNYTKNKTFLVLFVLVMLINTTLTVFLLSSVFGQTQRADFSSQKPVKVEVVEQKDCPLQIMVINVSNSGLSFQGIAYSLQNISSKPIRAYVLLGDGKRNGKVLTNSFATELFQPSSYHSDDLVEREILAQEEKISLSIDYVEFVDGSSWGTDSQGNSREIAGEREGRKTIIRQLKDSIKKQDAKGLNSSMGLLKQDIREIDVDMPATNQSAEWKKGFRGGYKAVISVLQHLKDQGPESINKKLDEMEKIAN